MTVDDIIKNVGTPVSLSARQAPRRVINPGFIPNVTDTEKLTEFVKEWEKKLCDWIAEYKKLVAALEAASGDQKRSLEAEKSKKDFDFNFNWMSRIYRIRQARAVLKQRGVDLPDPCDLKLSE